MKKNLVTFALGVAGLLCASTVSANVITVAPVAGNLYQQTVQSPCIFTNSSCQNGAFVGTPLPVGGNVNGYNEFSPNYTGAQISSIIGAGNSLLLGLDINQASGQPAQTLTLFQLLLNGNVVDSFSSVVANNVPATNNGNGFADYVLGNFSSFAPTDILRFHLVFDNANDGTENVFLIGGTSPLPPVRVVPEPASLALFGLGLFGLGYLRRKLVK